MNRGNTVDFGRPDWVMCGGPTPGGVRLLASKDMTYAELEAQRDLPDIDVWADDLFPKMLPPLRIKLIAGMKTFVIIEAPDYPAAFRGLFEQWTPGPGERAVLPGIPAIEAAPS